MLFYDRPRVGKNLFDQTDHFKVVSAGVVASARNDIQRDDVPTRRVPFGQARQGVPADRADVRQDERKVRLAVDDELLSCDFAAGN